MFNHYRVGPPDPSAPFPQQFRIESTWPDLTPYEKAIDDLVGNEGTMIVRAVYELAEKVENDFNTDFVQTEIGLEAARNHFEELVEKAREAFDKYERKLEDIEERRKYGEL